MWCHTHAHTPILSSSSDGGDNEEDIMDQVSGKPKVPLFPEWEKMAKKLLKGADPAKKLTWKTAEVGIYCVNTP